MKLIRQCKNARFGGFFLEYPKRKSIDAPLWFLSDRNNKRKIASKENKGLEKNFYWKFTLFPFSFISRFCGSLWSSQNDNTFFSFFLVLPSFKTVQSTWSKQSFLHNFWFFSMFDKINFNSQMNLFAYKVIFLKYARQFSYSLFQYTRMQEIFLNEFCWIFNERFPFWVEYSAFKHVDPPCREELFFVEVFYLCTWANEKISKRN